MGTQEEHIVVRLTTEEAREVHDALIFLKEMRIKNGSYMAHQMNARLRTKVEDAYGVAQAKQCHCFVACAITSEQKNLAEELRSTNPALAVAMLSGPHVPKELSPEIIEMMEGL